MPVPSIPTVIAATSRRLHLQMYTYGSPFTVCIDTGADCSLLTERAYHHLNDLYDVPLSKETRIFQAAQGSPLNIIGSVTLPVSFHNHDYTFDVKFYVVTNFVLNCDALLGYVELANHDISIYPRYQAVSYNGIMYYASDSPVTVLTVTSPRVHFEQSCPPAFDEALLPQRTQTSSSPQSNLAPSSQESKRSVSSDCCAAVIVGNQFIGPTSATKVPVRVLQAPVGACVISHPDSARIQRLALEGTLSTVRSGHITDALVTNLTGSSLTLKDGVHLGSFSVIDEASLQDSPPLIGAVDSQSISSCSSAELITQLEAHVKVVDFPAEKQRLHDILVAHRQAIALPGEPLGVTDRVQHHIDLQRDTRPIHVPSYRLPHSQRQVAQNLVQGMLDEGIIQESYSPWNSPLFLVPKKDGTYRAVIDFRKVNAVTVPDHYPLPVLSDILQSIGKDNTVFTTLDLKSGFWQIPLSPSSRPITAFSTPKGHFEWLRCPMGLRNSPLTCQRLVNSLFQGLIGDGLFVYLDDLILVSKDLDSHFQKLSLVLQKFTEAGLKLNITKCQFLRSRIEFLGHVVDRHGIHTTDAKVKAVQNFPTPTTTNNVRSFLGLAGYYRAFIKNFATIASPLTRLLKKNVPFHWDATHEYSFTVLKTALTQAPVLSFPDYSLPFVICSDASSQGIGSVLMQQIPGSRPQVIAFASRVLNACESRYSVTNLEALALVWSLKHFRDIIYGYPITVYTDHVAVTQLFKGKNLSGRLARWFLTIEEFNPDIKYLPGRANLVADALSRNVAVASITQVSNFSLAELANAQKSDPTLSQVIQCLQSNDHSVLPKLPVPLSEFSLQDDVLLRKVMINDKLVTQLVIPDSLIPTVLSLIHDLPHAGHPGRDKSIAMARTKYFWPHMSRDITNHVSQCVDCALNKGNTKTAPIQEYPTPIRPFETVAIDLLQLPRSKQGSVYVLVCVDHFSRYTVLIPLPNKSASSVAHAFVSHFICPYTTPSVLLSDNGTEFKNEVLQKICQQFHITQTFITAYHPASNGLVERTNRKILSILRHLVGKFHESWQDWLHHVNACINATINSSTGKTPHSIVFGHDKRFPFDMLEQPRIPVYSVDDYVQNQARAMQIIHDEVRRTLQLSRTQMTQRQHETATPVSFAIDDVVFKSAPERQSKLNTKFTGPFLIQEKLMGNKFKIFDPSLQTSEIVHADRLKKSDVRVTTTSPLPLSPVLPTSVSSSISLPSSSPYYLRSRANSL